ncbi:hypothetical protein E4U42_000216 [Claviceps africana]|uniref:Nasopharyngeal carcinoma susceptibility protein LZ16 n=1 Tax=Claviceps africana TaxID=83212 RepID=A0A8K0J1X9_9HYPO|nr:hypothetical protein E4U42_000216 [Claviceps africana]
MDAQNAADSDQTRPTGASPKRRRSIDTDSRTKPSSVAAASSSQRDAKAKPTASAAGDSHASTASPGQAVEDRDSDAETIVLPGKDGHSPSKARKVRQEDKSESDGDPFKGKSANGHAKVDHDGDKVAASASGIRPDEYARQKRLTVPVSAGSSATKNHRPRHKDAASSGLSSAPTSPPHHRHQNPLVGRRRSDAAQSSPSDSEISAQRPSKKTTLRDKLKSGERLPSQKRKSLKFDSDDESDFRKARPPRTTSVGVDSGRHKHSRSSHQKHNNRDASHSPPPPQHRRSTSFQLHSQLSSSNGPGSKKRRPPPLQSTDYQTDESSNGDSAHPRSSKLRSLTTAAAADNNASPAKMGPHKKHLDAHGQTLLARACARGEYDGAKQRLRERPEDLNVADYAGNTPLQIAAINGCEDIVKLLIDAGCNLDCVNYDKDTPLLDAVDNGHLGVVNLLLDAGVNPRKANVNGEEPIDRVTKDTDNADEIRAALMRAKKRAGERRRTSEDRHSHTDYPDARDSHAPDSPRHSPAAASGNTSRRSGTVRSTKTRNDLLYMPLDDKTLRQAAGRGDEETVARILQVKEGYDDPESMVAAARGGHDLVIQLLLGLGGANADPGPVTSLPAEFATPILAAIGQENIKVVELLLEQHGFDPTRRFKGETYYEIARRRQGTNWKEEEHLLKNAYDEYKRSHKDMSKTKSPVGRRERERISRREDVMEEMKSTKRHLASESKESGLKRKLSKLDASSEKGRSNSRSNNKGDDEFRKKTPARPRKEVSGVSDRELSPALSHIKGRRPESDVAGMSSEGEAAKPRRKLISKGELRGERDKQKRTSSHKEPSSPRENRGDDVSEKARPSERYHDRAKALKRDESSKDCPPSDGPPKRHRTSMSPERPSDVDKESHEVPAKRRRLDADSHECRTKRIASEDGRQRKSSSSRDGSVRPTSTPGQKERDGNSKRDSDTRPLPSAASSGERPIHVKDEDVDVPMTDLVPNKAAETRDEAKAKLEAARAKSKASEEEVAAKARKAEEDQRRAEAEKLKKKKKEEDDRRIEEGKKKRQQEEEAKKREEQEEAEAKKRKEQEEAETKKRKEQEEAEAKKRKEQEEAEAKKRKEQEEAEAKKRKEQEEAEVKKRKEQEEAEAKKRKEREERERLYASQREEEVKRKRAEEEKRKEEQRRREEEKKKEEEKEKEEEQRKRREEEELKQREEKERKHREDEERRRKEQLQREAAEEARRQREEEERKERERRDRAHREEMERKRAAREAELKRIREEQERVRLDKLPPLLQWLDKHPGLKTTVIADKFKNMLGVRYDTIRPAFNGTSEGREQWVLNTHVALLLGEKDLDLSRYTAWERVPVSRLAKITLWRTECPRYCLLSQNLWDLGRQLPGCYGDVAEPSECDFRTKQQLIKAAWEKFEALDMFFVKLSDFLYTVPNIPHLRNLRLAVEYRELLESESQVPGWQPTCKWKQDPGVERFHGFAPRRKYYLQGALVGEELPSVHQTSNTPFPENRVPRRGLVQVFSDDPDYVRICMEQGLEHLVNGARTPSLTNGDFSSPTMPNHITPTKAVVNGADGRPNGAHVNGIHGGSVLEKGS